MYISIYIDYYYCLYHLLYWEECEVYREIVYKPSKF